MAGPSKRPAKRPPSSGSGPSRQRKRPGDGRSRGQAAGKTATATGRTGTFTTRAAILLGIVLLLFASYTSSLHAWWQQRGEIQSKKAEIEMRKDAIGELKEDQQRWNDDAFIEKQARERFGWVLPGEVGYRVIGADGKIQGDVPTLDAPAPARAKQWHETLWDSVVEAGKEPKKEKAPAPDPDAVIKQKKKQ